MIESFEGNSSHGSNIASTLKSNTNKNTDEPNLPPQKTRQKTLRRHQDAILHPSAIHASSVDRIFLRPRKSGYPQTPGSTPAAV
jgi:hypothetical protein